MPIKLNTASGGGVILQGANTASDKTITVPADDGTMIYANSSGNVAITGDANITGKIGAGGANYGSAGQVLTSGGASAAPSWTTISATPTTSQVLSATSGAAVGDVGSYAGLRPATASIYSPGTTVAGSSLRYSGSGAQAGSTPSGTWRIMGQQFNDSNTTVWLRIS